MSVTGRDRVRLDDRPEVSAGDRVCARNSVRAALELGGGWQPHPRVADILRHFGIPVVATITAIGERAAVIEAGRLGYPVAVKSADPDLLHRGDIGAVRIGVADDEAVRAAYRAIATAVRRPDPAVLVQPMVTGPAELVAGVMRHPGFGSPVVVSLDGRPGSAGSRRWALADPSTVENLLSRLNLLARQLPEVAELYVSSVVAATGAVTVVDARMRLAEVTVAAGGALGRVGASG
jgi:acyl-CoA synthetase (NDP forming)